MESCCSMWGHMCAIWIQWLSNEMGLVLVAITTSLHFSSLQWWWPQPIVCLIFSKTNSLHVFFHYIYESLCSSSCLRPQHPSLSVLHYMSTPSVWPLVVEGQTDGVAFNYQTRGEKNWLNDKKKKKKKSNQVWRLFFPPLHLSRCAVSALWMSPTESAGLMYVVSLEAPKSGWPQLLTASQFATRTHAHFHLQLSGLSAVGTTAESLPLGNMICLPLINTPVCAVRQCNLHDCYHHYSCFSASDELLGVWLLLHLLQQFEALKVLKKKTKTKHIIFMFTIKVKRHLHSSVTTIKKKRNNWMII